MKLTKVLRGAAWTALGAAGLVVATHFAIRLTCRVEPPDVPRVDTTVTTRDGARHLGKSFARSRGKILDVRLAGAPAEIGQAHSGLLHREMVEVEGAMFADFRERMPWLLRTAVLDAGAFRYRNVSSGFDATRREEIAGQALGFVPDPFSNIFPTYQRLVFLNALYDIALSFEGTPLVGCTTFFVDARATGGGVLLARAFDFDVHPVFDQKKTVFSVLEDGRIPFLSVSWPGLVGVVSGMNEAGVAVVVHGARMGVTATSGEPVVHALRRVLSSARTAQDATRALADREPLVSHIVVVADKQGDAFAVERAPGHPNHVRSLGTAACVTNHSEGAFASDPKNQRVRAETSTLQRRARGDALLSQGTATTVADSVAMLRDRRAVDGSELPLGDRRAIDAQIASHGIVADLSEGVLWVSEGPNLVGRFLPFEIASDLHRLPQSPPNLGEVAQDPLAETERYRAFRKPPP